MEVLYLNLARRPDRDTRFRAVNAGIVPCQRVSAVDGRQLSVKSLIDSGVLLEPLTSYTSGALGSALSHKMLWDQCATGEGVLTVAEDDAVLHRSFETKATEVLASLPADWDIILWGWNFDSILHVGLFDGLKHVVMGSDGRPLGPAIAEFQKTPCNPLALRLFGAFGTVCYSITPWGARRLGQACFPLRNEPIMVPGLRRVLANFGIDVVMNKHYPAINAYVCFPPLAWTENDKTISDVSPRAVPASSGASNDS